MRLEAMLYCNILLCLCICVSNGAPPKEVSTGTSNSKLSYTAEEDKFIVEELLRLIDGKKSNKVWTKVTEKHNEKWRTKTEGFLNERSSSGLRNRFWGVLIHNYPHVQVKVPETFKEKLNKANLNENTQGASSSKSAASERLSYAQATNEELDEDPSVEKKNGPKARFSKEEDKFIFDEFFRIYDDYSDEQRRYVWKQIAANHCKKWADGAPGFTQERSAKSLYDRFRYVLASEEYSNRAKIPETWMQRLINQKPVYRYTPEEDHFIIKELSKPSITNIFSTPTLELLREKHDRKREAKIPGFENARTFLGLRGRVVSLKNSGQLPDEIKEKLTERQRAVSTASGPRRGETSSVHLNQQTDAETNEMIQELLNNTEYEFDFDKNFF